MNSETALITGASSGIGLHLAHEFARHGHPLVLVAPVEMELRSLASVLSAKYAVDVRTVAKDLERPESAGEIFEQLKLDGVSVDILVNNAGHGFRGHAWEHPIKQDISMVRLNIEAVLRMTKLFLPPMLLRGGGRVLNTASVAGFEPGPMMAVYHATKAFVLSWSEASYHRTGRQAGECHRPVPRRDGYGFLPEGRHDGHMCLSRRQSHGPAGSGGGWLRSSDE